MNCLNWPECNFYSQKETFSIFYKKVKEQNTQEVQSSKEIFIELSILKSCF